MTDRKKKCYFCKKDAQGAFLPKEDGGPKIFLCWDCREKVRNTYQDVILIQHIGGECEQYDYEKETA